MTGDPVHGWHDCTCGPYWSVIPPPPCPQHSWQPVTTYAGPFPAVAPRLSDEDIERIAKKLKELTG